MQCYKCKKEIIDNTDCFFMSNGQVKGESKFFKTLLGFHPHCFKTIAGKEWIEKINKEYVPSGNRSRTIPNWIEGTKTGYTPSGFLPNSFYIDYPQKNKK